MPDLKNYIVGRNADCDIRLDDQSVSREHVEITIAKDGRFYVTDCKSSLGTFVARNGEWTRLAQDFIEPEETLLLGRFQCTVRALLAQLPGSSISPGENRTGRDTGDRNAKSRMDDLPDGRVARDPGTGEIIGLDND